MDLSNLNQMAIAIAVVVISLSQTLKMTFNIKPRFMPILSLFVGIGVGIATTTISHITMSEAIWSGAISGLIGSGMFDLAKKTFAGNKDKEEETK